MKELLETIPSKKLRFLPAKKIRTTIVDIEAVGDSIWFNGFATICKIPKRDKFDDPIAKFLCKLNNIK